MTVNGFTPAVYERRDPVTQVTIWEDVGAYPGLSLQEEYAHHMAFAIALPGVLAAVVLAVEFTGTADQSDSGPAENGR